MISLSPGMTSPYDKPTTIIWQNVPLHKLNSRKPNNLNENKF